MVRTTPPGNEIKTKRKSKPKQKRERPDMIGNKYAVGNKGGGRPTLFKEEYLEQAYKLCLLGATDADLADFFGVDEDTINLWKRTHKDFYPQEGFAADEPIDFITVLLFPSDKVEKESL